MNLQATIHAAIEEELFGYGGCSAEDRVEEIIELLRKALVPNMPYRQFDLIVADVKRDAQEALSRYALINLETTSEAIVEALNATDD